MTVSRFCNPPTHPRKPEQTNTNGMISYSSGLRKKDGANRVLELCLFVNKSLMSKLFVE
jgi:hypothetical protein